jgi:hypothetical protein
MRDKQIEEMVKVMCCDRKNFKSCKSCKSANPNTNAYCRMKHHAEALYNKGYRKAAVGEWVDAYQGKYANQLYKCSVCGEPAFGNGKNWFFSKFCPSCGAKMKYESEGKR